MRKSFDMEIPFSCATSRTPSSTFRRFSFASLKGGEGKIAGLRLYAVIAYPCLFLVARCSASVPLQGKNAWHQESLALLPWQHQRDGVLFVHPLDRYSTFSAVHLRVAKWS